jgi:hypothetical protein
MFGEFVFTPVCGVVLDVIINSLICCVIPDNVVIKTSVPLKYRIDLPDLERTPPLVPPHNARQIFIQHWVVTTGESARFGLTGRV